MKVTNSFRIFQTLLLLLIFACEDEDPGPGPGPAKGIATIQIDKSSLKGWELATLIVTDYALTQEEFALQIGEKSFVAYKSSDSTVSFFTPGDLASGEYTLKSDVAKNSVEVTITAPTPISNPEDALQKYLQESDGIMRGYLKSYDDRVAAGLISVEDAAILKAAVSEHAQAIPTYSANLSSEEKVIYLQLIEANKHWLEEFLNAVKENPYTSTQRRAEGEDPSACAGLEEALKLAQSQGLDAVDIREAIEVDLENCVYNECIKKTPPAVKFSTVFANAVNAYRAETSSTKESDNSKGKGVEEFIKTIGSAAYKGLYETTSKCIKPVGYNNGLLEINGVSVQVDVNVNERRATTTSEFIAEKKYHISANATYINTHGVNSQTLSIFGSAVGEMGTLNKNIQELNEVVPDLPTIEFPAYGEQKRSMPNFTIDKISDSRISMELSEGKKGTYVTVSAKGIKEEKTPFTYRMKMENQYGSAEKVIEAIFVLSLEDILINNSPWNLTAYSAGDTDFFALRNSGNIACGSEGKLYDHKTKVIGGTYSFSEGGNASREGISEVHTYNCTTGSYKVTEESDSQSHQWKVDEESGRLVLIADGEEWAWLSANIVGDKITFSGTVKDAEEDEETSGYSFVIEKQ